jgi:hypothetical protein
VAKKCFWAVVIQIVVVLAIIAVIVLCIKHRKSLCSCCYDDEEDDNKNAKRAVHIHQHGTAAPEVVATQPPVLWGPYGHPSAWQLQPPLPDTPRQRLQPRQSLQLHPRQSLQPPLQDSPRQQPHLSPRITRTQATADHYNSRSPFGPPHRGIDSWALATTPTTVVNDTPATALSRSPQRLSYGRRYQY